MTRQILNLRASTAAKRKNNIPSSDIS